MLTDERNELGVLIFPLIFIMLMFVKWKVLLVCLPQSAASGINFRWHQRSSSKEEELSGASNSIKSASARGDSAGGTIRSFIFRSAIAEAVSKGVEWAKKAGEQPAPKKTSAGILTSGRDWQLLVDFEQQLKFPNHIAVTILHPDMHPERPSRWLWL